MDTASLPPDQVQVGLERRRRTLLVVDVVESVRLMERDEEGFIVAWRRFVDRVRLDLLPPRRGTLVKSLGDGFLVQFESPIDAVEAAITIAQQLDSGSVQLRMGMHSADVVIDDLDVYGCGVNIASRLASLARPGEIVASAAVRDAVADGVHARVTDLGECHLKHVRGTVRAFRLAPPGAPQHQLMDDPAEEMFAAIAVLPFDCRAADGSGIVLGNALADAVMARLGRVPGLRVISRLSTAALHPGDHRFEACMAHLGASFVVAGSCTLANGRLRGRARIEDVRRGSPVWDEVFDVDPVALFLDQDAGVEVLARGISHSVARAAVHRARRMPLPNLESFALYLGGVTLLHRMGTRDFARSYELLTALRDRHPRAAAPVAMLAKWHMLRVLQGWTANPGSEGRLSLYVARDALDKEPDHALALSMAAMMGAHFDGDIEAARALAEEAIEHDPQEPSAWMALAGILSYLHQGDASVACAKRAALLSPFDPCRFMFDTMLAAGQLAAGRSEEALESVAAALRLNAVHVPTYRLAVIANMLAGRAGEARNAARRLLTLDPAYRVHHFVERYPGRGQAHAADYARALREAGIPD